MNQRKFLKVELFELKGTQNGNTLPQDARGSSDFPPENDVIKSVIS
jgi:hypothetical protein